MRAHTALAALLLVLPACMPGPSGPELPPDIGASHAEPSRTAGGERPVVVTNTEPFEVGATVWANYHGTGFFFHGVVVERRDEEQHRVVYADGAHEWVPPSSLRPDSLGEEAEIDVRPAYAGTFSTAHVGRRLGPALYVRHANGDEGWTVLPHVRFSATGPHVPAATDEPHPEPEGELGSVVLVDYRRQGLRFAGVVTARREDGTLHVVYLDGESEWVDPRTTIPDRLDVGDVIHVRREWEPPTWVRGRVLRRVGSAFHVELDDGGLAWTSLFRVRVPTLGTRAIDPSEPSAPSDASPSDASPSGASPEPAPPGP